jgi:hypothetical protein
MLTISSARAAEPAPDETTKTITKRLCRLEGAVVSRQFREPSPSEILRERKRRRLGEAYRDYAAINLTDDRGRPLSFAEVLRAGRCKTGRAEDHRPYLPIIRLNGSRLAGDRDSWPPSSLRLMETAMDMPGRSQQRKPKASKADQASQTLCVCSVRLPTALLSRGYAGV